MDFELFFNTISTKSSAEKGIEFEKYCANYLSDEYKYVFMYNDFAQSYTNFPMTDCGVDIMCRRTESDGWTPVQCKFRKNRDKKISQRDVATLFVFREKFKSFLSSEVIIMSTVYAAAKFFENMNDVKFILWKDFIENKMKDIKKLIDERLYYTQATMGDPVQSLIDLGIKYKHTFVSKDFTVHADDPIAISCRKKLLKKIILGGKKIDKRNISDNLYQYDKKYFMKYIEDQSTIEITKKVNPGEFKKFFQKKPDNIENTNKEMDSSRYNLSILKQRNMITEEKYEEEIEKLEQQELEDEIKKMNEDKEILKQRSIIIQKRMEKEEQDRKEQEKKIKKEKELELKIKKEQEEKIKKEKELETKKEQEEKKELENIKIFIRSTIYYINDDIGDPVRNLLELEDKGKYTFIANDFIADKFDKKQIIARKKILKKIIIDKEKIDVDNIMDDLYAYDYDYLSKYIKTPKQFILLNIESDGFCRIDPLGPKWIGFYHIDPLKRLLELGYKYNYIFTDNDFKIETYDNKKIIARKKLFKKIIMDDIKVININTDFVDLPDDDKQYFIKIITDLGIKLEKQQQDPSNVSKSTYVIKKEKEEQELKLSEEKVRKEEQELKLAKEKEEKELKLLEEKVRKEEQEKKEKELKLLEEQEKKEEYELKLLEEKEQEMKLLEEKIRKEEKDKKEIEIKILTEKIKKETEEKVRLENTKKKEDLLTKLVNFFK